MKKTRLLLIGLLVLAILLIVVAVLTAGKKQALFPAGLPTPTPVSPFSPANQHNAPTIAPIPTGDTTIIDGVTTDNFYKTSGPFDSQGDTTLANVDGQYRITYLPGTDEFLVTITGPFDQNRTAAEQALLQTLNISIPDACRLHVVVQTITSANPDLAGQDFPLSFCQNLPTQGPTPNPQQAQTGQIPNPVTYQTTASLDIAIGSSGGGIPVPAGSLGTLVNAVNQILTCEGGGAYAPYPSCVNHLNIPQQFKNNLNATYPNFACGQFIWSAQALLGWTTFPGWVGSVFQWYTMNAGHRQNGYTFICNPYRIAGCSTSKTSQTGGAIAPGDIILYGSTGNTDPGHIAIVVGTQSDLFTIHVTEANYRHGVTWFRWTNLLDNLGRGANILGWWRKQ